MSMTGDRIEKETVDILAWRKVGIEFFDENGTWTSLEQINTI